MTLKALEDFSELDWEFAAKCHLREMPKVRVPGLQPGEIRVDLAKALHHFAEVQEYQRIEPGGPDPRIAGYFEGMRRHVQLMLDRGETHLTFYPDDGHDLRMDRDYWQRRALEAEDKNRKWLFVAKLVILVAIMLFLLFLSR
jgi:hypothetical protein